MCVPLASPACCVAALICFSECWKNKQTSCQRRHRMCVLGVTHLLQSLHIRIVLHLWTLNLDKQDKMTAQPALKTRRITNAWPVCSIQVFKTNAFINYSCLIFYFWSEGQRRQQMPKVMNRENTEMRQNKLNQQWQSEFWQQPGPHEDFRDEQSVRCRFVCHIWIEGLLPSFGSIWSEVNPTAQFSLHEFLWVFSRPADV